VDGDKMGARAYADGTVEVYKNDILLATRDVSSWSHYANGGYIGLWFINATDAVLDDFGGGPIAGGEGLTFAPDANAGAGTMEGESLESSSDPAIELDSLNVELSNVDTFWQGIPLDSEHDAVVTFAQLNEEAGRRKPQSNGISGDGVVHILYDVPNQHIQVWTFEQSQSWMQHGADIPVSFVNGDQFRARTLANGTVEIYRNGVLLATRNITTWSYYSNSGYLGV
jgi:hypothetical protein